ncbi:MAG: transcription termination/antitermination NusG family protein [Verrucomicrobiota bacterium]
MIEFRHHSEAAWYCLRTKTKREHIAAATLESLHGIEVCLPRLRHRKKTVRGPVMFTEALFPGYIFAYFDLKQELASVRSCAGVAGVLNFNDKYIPVEKGVIGELRGLATDNEVIEIKEQYQPGDSIEVVAGSFSGIRGLVQTYIPAKQRVVLLLEFLGRETEVEVEMNTILPSKLHPLVN